MSSTLKEFRDCCRLLASDKVTERRKQMDSLKFFLNHTGVLDYLDTNYHKKEGYSWDRLFESTICCVQMELEAFVKDVRKPSLSSTQLATLDRKKRSCAGLLKLVLSKANEGVPKIKINMLTKHMLEVMGNDTLREHLFVEYSSILEKHVLGNQKVMRDVAPAIWNNFVAKYVDVYKSLKTGANFGIILRTLEGLVRMSGSHASLNSKLLFTFYRDAVKQSRDLKFTGTIHASLLSACHSFCVLVATDCRQQVCHLGEEIVGILLALLDDSCAKQLKGIIFRFMSLQMACHHPGGATTDHDGMMAIDTVLWKRSLHRLYSILTKDLQQTSSFKGRLLQENSISSEFLELLVNVSHQEFAVQTSDEEVDDSGSLPKKRRLNRGIIALVERLQNMGQEVPMAWFQFLSALLRRHPSSVTTRDEFKQILQLLHNFQLECKQSVIMSHVLDAIASTLYAYCINSKGKMTHEPDPLLPYWTKIYDATVRTVTVNQCVSQAHILIQELIIKGIVCAGPELESLFVPRVGTSPSPYAIQTLAVILKHGNFTKFPGASSRKDKQIKLSTDPTLYTRFQLLEWLLPDLTQESTWVDPRSSFSGCTVDMLGEIFAVLALRECNVINALPTVITAIATNFASLESSYLQSTFCDTIAADVSASKCKEDLSCKKVVLPAVRDKILELFHRNCAALLDVPIASQSDSITSLGLECCLVIKFMGNAIRHSVLSISDLAKGRLCDILQNLMLKLAQEIQAVHEKENSVAKTQTLLNVVSWLHYFCLWEENDVEHNKTMTQFCREMISDKLVTILVELIYDKPQVAINGAGDNQTDKVSSYDPEFDDVLLQDSSDKPVTDDATLSVECSLGVAYNEVTELRTKAMATLSCLCRHARAPLLSPMRAPTAARGTADSHHSIQSRLLEPLTRPTYKLDSAENTPLVFSILNELTEPFQQLNEQHIAMMLNVLQNLCKIYFKDAECSNTLLRIIARFLPKLVMAAAELRSKAILLVKGFWDCRIKKKSSPLVELGIASVLVALSQCDPVVYTNELGTGICDGHNSLSPSLLIGFLKTSEHPLVVSSFAANHITTLVKCWDVASNTIATKPMREHEKLLQQVLVAIEDSAVSANGYLASQDLLFNWTGAALTALTQIAMLCPSCVKFVLFAMVKHGREVPAARPTIRRAILRISATSNKHANISEFLTVHMAYIVQQCIEKGFGLDSHLWDILEPKNEFIQIYYPIVVPFTFVYKDMATREFVCEILGRPWKELVEECYPMIMTWILPGFATEDSPHLLDASIMRQSRECQQSLEDLLTAPVINALLLTNLDKVVVCLLKSLRVDSDITVDLPPPSPPYYSQPVVRAALNCISRACSDPNKSLVSLICTSPDGIQKILLALHIYLQENVEFHDVYRAVVMYEIFVGMLLDEFHTGLNSSWPFVLEDVIHTLAHQIARFRLLDLNLVITKACLLLHNVVSTSSVCALAELSKLLPIIVDCLIPVASDSYQEAASQALATLNFIVMEHGDEFKTDLAIIEPFPDTDVLATIRCKHLGLKFDKEHPSLTEELTIFLKRTELSQGLNRTQGLQRLQRVLASQKNELVQLVVTEDAVDDAKYNLWYSVVITLFNICESYPPKSDIVLHAAMCLGEIGPIYFPTLVLRRPSTVLTKPLSAFDGNAVSQRLLIVFHRLHTYLMGNDITVKVIASQVLKQILATKSGKDFAAIYRRKDIGHLFQYLKPFVSDQIAIEVAVSSDPETVLESLDEQDNLEFGSWLQQIIKILIDARASDCEVTQLLGPLCFAQVEFCEDLLPFLVHAILLATKKLECQPILSKWMNNFFAKFSNHLDNLESTPPSSQSSINGAVPIFTDKRAVRVMLSVVQHLRLQIRAPIRGKFLTVWDNNFWLDINYLNAAKAADHCQAHFTALMFLEIWCHKKTRDYEMKDNGEIGGAGDNIAPKLDRFLSCGAICGKETRDLLLRINQNIGDPDAINGCQISRLAEQRVRLQYYMQEGHWDRALGSGDLTLQSGTTEASPETLLQTMHKMGLNHLSQLYFDNLVSGGRGSGDWNAIQVNGIREHQNLCAWKMAKWSVPPSSDAEEKRLLLNGCVYQSVLSLREGDNRRFDRLCRYGHELVINDLKHGSLESMSSLRQPFMNLALLNTLMDGRHLNNHSDQRMVNSVLKKWSDDGTILRHMGNEAEIVNSLRCSLLDSSLYQTELVQPLLIHLLQQVKLSISAGLLQWAELYVARAATVADVTLKMRMQFKLEEAKIFWARAERDAAVGLLNFAIVEMERNNSLVKSKVYGQALGTYGGWLIETRTENATVVLDNFLDKSISILEKFNADEDDNDDDTLLSAYLSTSRYADSQYQLINDYLESAGYKLKQDMIVQSMKACDAMSKDKTRSLDHRRAYNVLEAQIKIDQREVESLRENRRVFLDKAMRGYVNCLRQGDKHDTRVFRLVSLWFSNTDSQAVDAQMNNCVQSIASRKFLPLIYQLAARMDSTKPRPSFQSTLQNLIERVTLDHPYHALNILFALSNSAKDAEFLVKRQPVTSRRSVSKEDQEGRVQAAKSLLEKLSKSDHLGPIIWNMAKLCDALIELSYWVPKVEQKHPGEKFSIPGDKQITKLVSLEHIPPLTMNIPIAPTCDYRNIPILLHYKKQFQYCGGVNAPKKVSCSSSDGREYLQLVKGNDDLRQDNVMQQVFGIVNGLLKSNSETSLRQLSIGTYKVVPLSQRSGVLEWCRNTEPICSYLVGDSNREGAHKRYNPKDWLISTCRNKMKSVAEGTHAQKLATYLEVTSHLKPVFRHFFLENFPEPPVWYEKRVAYIKSVATTSIVGYILGLGDRHVSNILIDKRTAQFIHIDFGIAFEQGRNLPTPETVPFRLTRDVVDGMGVMGTDGIFRRCCEKTMEVMRESQEVILTILGVFLYDPLYQWTLSPIKCHKLQGQADRSSMDSNTSMGGDMWLALEGEQTTQSATNINKLAERVLLRLQDKLQGKEDGTILSISGQVSHLIQVAVDPKNLCRLFNGWQAYL